MTDSKQAQINPINKRAIGGNAKKLAEQDRRLRRISELAENLIVAIIAKNPASGTIENISSNAPDAVELATHIHDSVQVLVCKPD